MTEPRFARNGDVRLALRHWSQRGEPLLLINGLGGVRYEPGMVTAMVDAGFDVVTYDHRDSGESSSVTGDNSLTAAMTRRGSSPYSAEDLTDDAVAVMTEMGWTSASLFGFSMGGLIAQRIALRHSDRVRSLVIGACVCSDDGVLRTLTTIKPSFLRAVSKIKYPNTPQGDIDRAVALARITHSPRYPFDEAAVRDALTRTDVTGIGDTTAQSRQLGGSWHGPKLTSITAPAVVFTGDADQIIRQSTTRRIAKRIPDAEHVVLPGIGHSLPDGIWPDLVAMLQRSIQSIDNHERPNARSADRKGLA